MQDFTYFGPPRADGTISPYWPGSISWNLPEACETIGTKLSRVGEIVNAGPYRGMPRKMKCICAGTACLLPVLDRICELQGVVRIDLPNNMVASSRYLQTLLDIVPFLARTRAWSRLICAIGYDRASFLKARQTDHFAILEYWEVDDISELCEVLSTPNSTYWTDLIEVARSLQ